MITNLGRTASPVFRYRTGDLVVAGHRAVPLRPAPAPLERRSARPARRHGHNPWEQRFPLEHRRYFACEFAEIAEYRIDVETHRAMQHIKITIEPQAGTPAAPLVEKVGRTIRDRLHFQAEVVGAAPGTLPRFEMKSRRFFRDAARPKSLVAPRSQTDRCHAHSFDSSCNCMPTRVVGMAPTSVNSGGQVLGPKSGETLFPPLFLRA